MGEELGESVDYADGVGGGEPMFSAMSVGDFEQDFGP